MAFVRQSVCVHQPYHFMSASHLYSFDIRVNSVKCSPYWEDVQNPCPSPVTSRPHHKVKDFNLNSLCQLHISSNSGRILMKRLCKTHVKAVSYVLLEGQGLVFL
ncbi:hypothetical protein ACF0H5_011012 [Mactra antiquata]